MSVLEDEMQLPEWAGEKDCGVDAVIVFRGKQCYMELCCTEVHLHWDSVQGSGLHKMCFMPKRQKENTL